jgi:hypothetical protein
MKAASMQPETTQSRPEYLGALFDIEAQISGAIALIRIEDRAADPHGDPDGSLLQATRLLDKALAMSRELAAQLDKPEVPTLGAAMASNRTDLAQKALL